MTQWKQTKYENYLASDDGQIYSKLNDLVLKPTQSRYLRVSIFANGKSWTVAVHRLVAETFIPNPLCKETINHIDGNKHNNCVSNLEWCTQGENKRHAAGLDLVAYGSAVNTARLTEETAMDALILLSQGVSSAEIGRRFGVTRATISKLKKGQTWKRLGRAGLDITIEEKAYGKKLCYEDVVTIKEAILEGFTDKELAAEFNVAPGTINQIRHNRTWRSI